MYAIVLFLFGIVKDQWVSFIRVDKVTDLID